MLYQINESIFNDFSKFEENKLNPRSYFIPFASMEELNKTTYLTERFASSRVMMLSGEWDFKYYASSRELPLNLDTDKVKFDKLEVPSTWQRNGYDQIAYINTRYAFKKNPPHVPLDQPVAVYRKKFTITDIDNSHIITFLGVANNLSLYVNGAYVGYSEGSHNTAEFKLDNIHEGENELVVVMYKWCNGSYLECQDMFRENGIFRDVFITSYRECHITDYLAKSEYVGDGKYKLHLSVEGEFNEKSVDVKAKLVGNNVSKDITLVPNELTTIEDLEPDEWTPETPNLYELVVSLYADGEMVECFRQYIGFKHIEIEGEVFKFNDVAIKMKGVNHHDTDPIKGYVMNVDDLLRDIKLMKEYNVNTVRTSHYPPDPIMITMCDFYGLYVIDEADIETHGFYAVPYTTNNPNRLSNDETWKDHYLDRVVRMYYRDRNHPSITMWSLGNEAGGHKCQDACYDYLHKYNPEVPVHYEGVIRSARWAYDVVSHMYASHDLMEGILEDRKGLHDIMGHKAGDHYKGKPFFQCEYAHAMGVGPGGLDDYVKLFYKSPQFLGGCIWEWADHSVYDENAKYKWTYGGDHNEPIHDGNFCVDGLFFPDRRPSTGALNMKAVYRPIRAEYVSGNTFTLTNTNDFVDSSYIAIKYEVLENGVVKNTGDITKVIPAKTSVDVDITINAQPKAEIYVKFSYMNKNTGMLIAEDGDFVKKYAPETKMGKLVNIAKNNGILEAKFNGGKVAFSKKTGEMVSYECNGVEYMNKTPDDGFMGFRPKAYRKEIDNERFTKIFWSINCLAFAKEHVTSVKLSEKDGVSKVVVKYGLTSFGILRLLNAKVVYTIDESGRIRVDASLSKVSPFVSSLPKFGLSAEINPALSNIEYYGRGNAENLSDFNAHAPIGIYNTTVHDMPLEYIMPQDSGNRGDVRWVKFTDDKGNGLKVSAIDAPFNFNANEYSYNTLKKAYHIEDLDKRNTAYVAIDGFVRGAGSNSCGPSPRKEHVIRVKYSEPLKYSFVMEPIVK